MRPLIIAISALIFLYTSVANSQEKESLVPGQPIERELSGGQTHSYKIATASGQYLQILVEQRGVDVGVTLLTPEGKKMVELDSVSAIEGSETVSAIAEAAGSYTLEVRAVKEKAKMGRYEIKLGELRAATVEDKNRVAAE